MRKTCLLAAILVFICANAALAQSIAGKFGVSARGGFIIPSDDELVGAGSRIETQVGWAAGGGLIYGITDNIAAEAEVTYSQFNGKLFGIDVGTGKTTDIALGAQYRFMPQKALVPYVGVGIDFILNSFDNNPVLSPGQLDVDWSFGGYLKTGVDYFITPQVALNAEFKGVICTTADVKDFKGYVGAKFDPSNISGLFGVKLFFN
jgi:outer membrane protein